MFAAIVFVTATIIFLAFLNKELLKFFWDVLKWGLLAALAGSILVGLGILLSFFGLLQFFNFLLM